MNYFVIATMQYLLVTLVLIGSLATSMFAQDDKLSQFSFEDVPTEDVRPPYFAVAGGPTATWLFTNLTDVNSLVNGITGNSYSAPLLMFGGEGFAAIGFIPNVRVGIMGASSFNPLQNEAKTRRVEYTVSLTGVIIDYAITPLKGFSIVPGVVGGIGGVNLEISQSGGNQIFPQISPTITSANYMRRLRTSMTFVMPRLNIEYAFTSFSMIRINAGYNLSFTGDWQGDNISAVTGVPATINGTGLTAQIGLFVGLFNN
jgi:hypothetical protein